MASGFIEAVSLQENCFEMMWKKTGSGRSSCNEMEGTATTQFVAMLQSLNYLYLQPDKIMSVNVHNSFYNN